MPRIARILPEEGALHILAVDSGANLPPILEESCHLFCSKPATHSG